MRSMQGLGLGLELELVRKTCNMLCNSEDEKLVYGVDQCSVGIITGWSEVDGEAGGASAENSWRKKDSS